MTIYARLLELVLAAAIGLAVGTTWRPREVRAQGGSTVYVDRVMLLGLAASEPVAGSQVVGFSCVETQVGTQCYIASR